MDSVKWSDFRKLSLSEVKNFGSVEITADGKPFGVFIIPGTDFIQDSARELAKLSNTVR